VTDGVRALLRGVGELLMTLGVVVLLFAAYELWFTNVVTALEQERLGDDLRRTWAQPAQPAPPSRGEAVPATVASPDLGEGFAVLHVPALDDYDPWVVVEGVSVPDLKNGPGHMPDTALPGELGNVVLSGHRTTYGAPFSRFDELAAGDAVVLETADGWFTYTVRDAQIVAPTAVEVTFPVPGNASAEPSQRLLTLTTCHPKYSAEQRLIVRAELTGRSDRTEGPPPVLASGR
jgi:sortase A